MNANNEGKKLWALAKAKGRRDVLRELEEWDFMVCDGMPGTTEEWNALSLKCWRALATGEPLSDAPIQEYTLERLCEVRRSISDIQAKVEAVSQKVDGIICNLGLDSPEIQEPVSEDNIPF